MGDKILILNDFNIVNSSQVVRFYSQISGIPVDSPEIFLRIYCDLTNIDESSCGVYIGSANSREDAFAILEKIALMIAEASDGSIVDLRKIIEDEHSTSLEG